MSLGGKKSVSVIPVSVRIRKKLKQLEQKEKKGRHDTWWDCRARSQDPHRWHLGVYSTSNGKPLTISMESHELRVCVCVCILRLLHRKCAEDRQEWIEGECCGSYWSTGIPHFIALDLLRLTNFFFEGGYCRFTNWSFMATLHQSETLGAIFPKAFAHFMFLCHILVILRIFQIHYY